HFLHVSGKQLAKSVLLSGPRSGNHILGVLPATHQVDLEAVSTALQGVMRIATREEVPEIFRDCEWGALVPFGTLYGVATLLDDSFDAESMLVFEAQLHSCAIR